MNHADLWRGIDTLAAELGLSVSGLAKLAALDPTTFNPSKRQTADGRERWPSTESLAKVLSASGIALTDFAAIVSGARPAEAVSTAAQGRLVPKLPLDRAASIASFDAAGFPAGLEWLPINLPALDDPYAYALEISDDSMAPLFRMRDLIVVSPTAPVRQGDRVVVRTVRGELLLRQLLHRTAKRLEIRGFNQSAPVRLIDAILVKWVHRIVWVSQ